MKDSLNRRSVLKALGSTSIAAAGGIAFTGTASAYVPCYDVSVAGIPDNYLVTYKDAGAAYNLDWAVLAGVGRVETNHGRLEAGCDESGAGARGPMQFMPATWDAYGVDGDGDGDRDICDYQDAIPAAANYLDAMGAPEDYRQALSHYYGACVHNYCDAVLCIAEQYRQGGGGGGGGGISMGDRVTPTANLNTRYRPGLESRVLATMPPGTEGEIMNGPVDEDGYTWWGVHWLADDIWGWSAGEYLTNA
jgi:hypothetical protein